MNYTIIIIAITAIVSLAAFNDQRLFDKLILWPRKMHEPKEYYRLLTSGFIHANWPHLIFNMIALYFFGTVVEQIIKEFTGMQALYLVLYITGIVVASLPTFFKHRNNSAYRSLGASGGVASVLFVTFYFQPWSEIYLFFIPIGIPSILFATAYLIYSGIMSKRANSHINHGAHFWGAIYGLVFAFVIDPTHGRWFIDQLMSPHYKF